MKTELALEILQQKRPDRFFAAVTKSIVGLRPGCLNRHPLSRSDRRIRGPEQSTPDSLAVLPFRIKTRKLRRRYEYSFASSSCRFPAGNRRCNAACRVA
jgi:hypothetical protein